MSLGVGRSIVAVTFTLTLLLSSDILNGQAGCHGEVCSPLQGTLPYCTACPVGLATGASFDVTALQIRGTTERHAHEFSEV